MALRPYGCLHAYSFVAALGRNGSLEHNAHSSIRVLRGARCVWPYRTNFSDSYHEYCRPVGIYISLPIAPCSVRNRCRNRLSIVEPADSPCAGLKRFCSIRIKLNRYHWCNRKRTPRRVKGNGNSRNARRRRYPDPCEPVGRPRYNRWQNTRDVD